jgi:hypothetical protein
MSYDVFIFKFPESYSSVSLLPQDLEAEPLGSAAQVRAAIDQVFDGTNWNDPTWGLWHGDLGSIEFGVGQENPVSCLALHIRAHDAVMAGVVSLCRENGWQAMDGGEDFVEQRSQPADGLNAWRAYRDKVIKP